jgi:hypothetical protein
LAGDEEYRARHLRDWLWKHGIKPVIPRKDNAEDRPVPGVRLATCGLIEVIGT